MTALRRPGTRPFDPRLLRRIPAVRRHLAVLAGLGVVAAAVVVGQAVALSTVLAGAAGGRLETAALAGFGAAVAARAGWVWLSGLVAARTAARVKQELRGEIAAAIGQRGPDWLAGQRAGEIATWPASGPPRSAPCYRRTSSWRRTPGCRTRLGSGSTRRPGGPS